MAYALALDAGQFGVMLQNLSADGVAIGEPELIAMTAIVYIADAGPQFLPDFYAPSLAVSDDGAETTVCWEDYGTSSNAFGECGDRFPEEIVVCASLDENGVVLDAGYSNCGSNPLLELNPSSRVTQLLFTGVPFELMFRENVAVDGWVVGQGWGVSAIEFGDATAMSAFPIDSSSGGALITEPGGGEDDASQLFLVKSTYASGTLTATATRLDKSFVTSLFQPHQVAAAVDPSLAALGILDSDGLTLHARLVQLPGGAAGVPFEIPTREPINGAIAAGTCPGGFAYLATTEHDTVLFVEAAFDGGLVPASEHEISLEGFAQSPGDFRTDYDLMVPTTSMAVAPATGGNLLLAISNPGQLRVYLLSCP